MLSLLRNPDYAVYGAATTSKQRGMEKGESKFNRMSMEERGKIKEETMVNYDGRSRRSTYSGYVPCPGRHFLRITIPLCTGPLAIRSVLEIMHLLALLILCACQGVVDNCGLPHVIL